MKNKTTNQPLLHDMVLLTDAFAEHICVSAFLMRALPAVLASEDTQIPEIVEGARLCADMLQSRTRELKQSLDHALDRYRVEHGVADSSGK